MIIWVHKAKIIYTDMEVNLKVGKAVLEIDRKMNVECHSQVFKYQCLGQFFFSQNSDPKYLTTWE